jgi:glutamate racemase
MQNLGPIGLFDSGYGGLTVLKAIRERLPAYDYLYLGDNARVPYGTRSYETVYQFSWECIQALFAQGCQLVIVACNTASAKALRTIQQINLPKSAPNRRVLGVIRPTTEDAHLFTRNNHLGILGTNGTIQSNSYPIEINKFHPQIKVSQQACPMWVPLVEQNEHLNQGADYFIKKYLDALLNQDPLIDGILLGCTHYPLLLPKLKEAVQPNIRFIAQGDLVAEKLAGYLQRHPDIDVKCSKSGTTRFLTTDDPFQFESMAKLFYGKELIAEHIDLHEVHFERDAD